MASVEQDKSLSALRKLYYRLERLHDSTRVQADRLDMLTCILYAEATRRKQNLINEKSRNRELDRDVLSTISKLVSKVLGSVNCASGDAKQSQMLKEWMALTEVFYSELRKHEELLDSFDERYAGYFYQFSCEFTRKEALKRIQSADKRSEKDDIILFTQLYTPDWVSHYLVANSILPLWCEFDGKVSRWFHPGSAGVPPASERSFQKRAGRPRSRVIDPACGCGHLLVSAFDLLLDLYKKEGMDPCVAAQHILNSDLTGCDLDKHALWICGFALLQKANLLGPVEPSQITLRLVDVSTVSNSNSTGSHADLETGSLKRDWPNTHVLSERYDVVISNPPYIGRRLLDRRMKQFLKTNFPNAYHDISAAFLARALELTNTNGRVAFITQSSLLFLPSYGSLRKALLDNRNLISVVELGTRVFPLAAGEKIDSMLIVLQSDSASASVESTNQMSAEFLDLRKSSNKKADLLQACANTSNTDTSDSDKASFVLTDCNEFRTNRALAFNYKCPTILTRILQNSAKLGDSAEVKQGLATSDNARFVRFWWDVPESEINKRWRPYVKGAGSERWHAPCQTVVDWLDNGQKIKSAVETNYPYLKGRVKWVVKNEQYYFRPGLTFSFVSTGLFAARRMNEGAIFDVGGSALFCSDEINGLLLAYLNSSFAAICVNLLNPTFNCQVGDIKQVPLPNFPDSVKKKLTEIAEEAYLLKSRLNALDETQILHEVPNYISCVLSGEQEPQRAWSELSGLQSNAISRICQMEEELDKTILDSLQSLFHCSSSELESLSLMMKEKKRDRKPTLAPVNSEREFAEAVLRAFIDKIFNDTESTNKRSFCRSLEFENPFDNEMNPKLSAWIEHAVEMPLSNYMKAQFNKVQLKLFQNSPRFFCVRSQNQDRLILISNRILREFLYNTRKEQSFGQTQDGRDGSEVLSRVEEKLNRIIDWTGKDLHNVLN